MNQITLSTVTPVYNGSKYLPDLVEAIHQYKQILDGSDSGLVLIESIFVIDEAIDESASVLEKLKENYPWLNVITLSKNFGQHPATIAGILHTSGDWVITLDEDLQHKPSDITNLLHKVCENNSDICYANSKENVHKSFIKDSLARFFKYLMARVLNNPNTRLFNSFRLVRGSIARGAAAICRHETYLDIALSWFTKRVVTSEVNLVDDRNQNSGESGYSLMGLIRHAKRMVMSSKIKILRLAIPIGILAFIFSILFSAYALISAALKYDTTLHKGWTSTILVVLFFGGLSILLISILLESISDIMLSINGKPTFFVVDRSKDEELKTALSKIEHASLPK